MDSKLKLDYEPNSNFNFHELVNPPSSHQYNNPPKIQMDQRQPFQRLGQNQNQLGGGYVPQNLSYKKMESQYFQKPNIFDIDNKVNIPVNNCRKNDLNSLYNEFGNAGEMKNIDYENYIKYGYPTSKARSLGFENPFEHQYQFIDSDIQDPSHVVSDRPISSRLDNKTIAKPKNREIY
jgi:hypothetical protein